MSTTTYRIKIAFENAEKWENWGGTTKEIITSIIDKLREDYGPGLSLDCNRINVPDDNLIDFCDDNGIVIADFKIQRGEL